MSHQIWFPDQDMKAICDDPDATLLVVLDLLKDSGLTLREVIQLLRTRKAAPLSGPFVSTADIVEDTK